MMLFLIQHQILGLKHGISQKPRKHAGQMAQFSCEETQFCEIALVWQPAHCVLHRYNIFQIHTNYLQYILLWYIHVLIVRLLFLLSVKTKCTSKKIMLQLFAHLASSHSEFIMLLIIILTSFAMHSYECLYTFEFLVITWWWNG